jgi:prepilin-type N-terminal cleavage/methylation domain-containing protein
MRQQRQRGFTLLEVLVSLAILALALGAIAGINANSFEASNYARFVSVATLLGRSKMIDIEEELRKDGLGESEKELSGDFSSEGYPSISWSAVARPVEIDLNQMIGGLLGGDVSSDSLPENLQGFLTAFQGGGSIDGGGEKEPVGGSELGKLLGGGGFEMMLRQVGDTLGKSIREITLEISWGGKHDQETVKFVQYVTTFGRLAAPQAPPLLGIPGTNPGDRNPDTGAVRLPPGLQVPGLQPPGRQVP